MFGFLVLVAAVILLFSGRYQRPLFDLILGFNRWIYRVITYVALMRDEYPPFRLDQGARDTAELRPEANTGRFGRRSCRPSRRLSTAPAGWSHPAGRTRSA